MRRMLSRWRSRAVTSITATICTSTFCCKRAVADGIMPVNPVPATVYTHCRSKKLTVQWERFRSLFERAPDGADFIIYSAVGGVLDPDHLSAYWRDVLDGPAPAARSVSRHSPHVRDARHRAGCGCRDSRRFARARRCDDYYALLRSSARSVHAPRNGSNRAGRENRSRMAEYAAVCTSSHRGENPESGTENTSAAQTYRGMCLKYTKGKSVFYE